MYSDVVMEKAGRDRTAEGMGVRHHLKKNEK